MKITFVNEPWRVPQGPYGVGLEFYMPFVTELSRHAGVVIPVKEGFLPDVAPPDGFILFHCTGSTEITLAQLPEAQRTDIASRLIPIDVPFMPLYESLLEPFSIPAAVDSLAYGMWGPMTPKNRPAARGLLGLRELGATLGAGCDDMGSERYCSLYSDRHEGLPHLLADYLAAWRAESSP